MSEDQPRLPVASSVLVDSSSADTVLPVDMAAEHSRPEAASVVVAAAAADTFVGAVLAVVAEEDSFGPMEVASALNHSKDIRSLDTTRNKRALYFVRSNSTVDLDRIVLA